MPRAPVLQLLRAHALRPLDRHEADTTALTLAFVTALNPEESMARMVRKTGGEVES